MSKNNYIRLLKQPTYAMLKPVIQAAFQTSHDQFGLEKFSHSGIYFSQADFDKLQIEETVWLGAFNDDVLIGCVSFTPMSPTRYRIHKLAVMPEKRGTGLGRFLMVTAEKEAFSRGARKIELVCLANDEVLVDFYKRLGYQTLKEKNYKLTTWRIAYMEKRMPHLVDQVGSNNLAFHLPVQSCEALPLKAFEIVLVYHPEEIIKQSNTGHVVQRCLPDHTKEIIWHRNTIDSQIADLSPDYETVLLFPSEEAMPLSQFCRVSAPLIQGDKAFTTDEDAFKPLRLVVVDATWQQAQKMMAQSPSLRALKHVKLVHVPKSQYILRKNQKTLGLCTLEAIAEAISELGYLEAKNHVMMAFLKWMAKGFERYGVHMGALDDSTYMGKED